MVQLIEVGSPAYNEIIRAVTVAGINEANKQRESWDYVGEKEAMQLLDIKSKNTLASYRNERKISYSRPSDRVILYSRKSIEAFLNKHKINSK